MIGLIQRVSVASVSVNGLVIGQIDKGILALLAVEKTDTTTQADRLLQRILDYRIFPDADDKMNLSLRDIHGGLLVVPQFTLAANTEKGKRPSFAAAAPPEMGRALFEYVQQQACVIYPHCQFGQFGADMKVMLINEGPVTFTLRCN